MTIWNGENDFALFKKSVPISSQAIWTAFYHLHKEKVQVQKESVAIEKLRIIINATFKLSNHKGFSLMSLRDLSQATSMSMGSLYNYIGSKSQLAEMIHQFLPYMFNICIGEQIQTDDSAKLKLEKLIRGHIFVSEALQPWFFFAFMETKHLSRSVKELAKNNDLRSEELMQCFISKGIEDNAYQPCDLFLTSMMIKALLQNWFVKHSKYRSANVTCENYIKSIEQVIKKQLIC
ncbi:MAG: AcrR family transcriptional regulator [Polaribacter sp.]|jgi:AcrR family transcriptional regulator